MNTTAARRLAEERHRAGAVSEQFPGRVERRTVAAAGRREPRGAGTGEMPGSNAARGARRLSKIKIEKSTIKTAGCSDGSESAVGRLVPRSGEKEQAPVRDGSRSENSCSSPIFWLESAAACRSLFLPAFIHPLANRGRADHAELQRGVPRRSRRGTDRCLRVGAPVWAGTGSGLPAVFAFARDEPSGRLRRRPQQTGGGGYHRRRDPLNPRVVDAIRRTPRHEFTPFNQRHLAYYDMASPIGNGRRFRPLVVAYMTEQPIRSPTTRCWRSAPAAVTRRPYSARSAGKCIRSRSSSAGAAGGGHIAAPEARERQDQDRRRPPWLA